jgi:hypothetical protein
MVCFFGTATILLPSPIVARKVLGSNARPFSFFPAAGLIDHDFSPKVADQRILAIGEPWIDRVGPGLEVSHNAQYFGAKYAIL